MRAAGGGAAAAAAAAGRAHLYQRCCDAYWARCEPSRHITTLRADPWLRWTVPALVVARLTCVLLLAGWCHPWRFSSLSVADEVTLWRDEQQQRAGWTTTKATTTTTTTSATASLANRTSEGSATPAADDGPPMSPYSFVPHPGCVRDDLNAALIAHCVPALSTFQGGCTAADSSEHGGVTALYTGGWVFALMFSAAGVGVLWFDDRRDVVAVESGMAFACVVAPLVVLNVAMLLWGTAALDLTGTGADGGGGGDWALVSAYCKPLESTRFGTIRSFDDETRSDLQPLNGRCVVSEADAISPAIGWYNRTRYTEHDVASCHGATWNRTLLMIALMPSGHVLEATATHLARWRHDVLTLLQVALVLVVAIPVPAKWCVRALLTARVRRRCGRCCGYCCRCGGGDGGGAYALVAGGGGGGRGAHNNNNNVEDNLAPPPPAAGNGAGGAVVVVGDAMPLPPPDLDDDVDDAIDDDADDGGGDDGPADDHDDDDDDEPPDDSAVVALLDAVGRRDLALQQNAQAAAAAQQHHRNDDDPAVAERRARDALLAAEKRDVRQARDAVCACCIKLELAHAFNTYSSGSGGGSGGSVLPRELHALVASYCVVHQHDVCVRIVDCPDNDNNNNANPHHGPRRH